LVAGGILISTNDTTILALLSRYPDIPTEEADEYISNIEHEENVPLCHAVIGRIEPEDLDDEARTTYDEFTRWSLDRTRRFRNEQIDTRQRQKENRTAIRMTQLHEQGLISNEVMLLYGISGVLPERSAYLNLSEEEKEAIWTEKMERRFGPNWRQRFEGGQLLPSFLRKRVERFVHDWLKEGF
jgi:hypothetical protein